jgi:polyisoprenoid-binding protein YceI
VPLLHQTKSIKITMKKVTVALGIFIVLFASAFKSTELINWKVKEGAYSVSFNGGKIKGVLTGLKATILFDEISPEKSKIYASVDVNTINTGSGMKNKHAKTESALDVEKFSMIIFESTSIYKNGTDYEAKGKLSIKGVTKEIILPFTFTKNGDEAVFKGKFSIATKDYNITRMGSPDDVVIELDVPVTK